MRTAQTDITKITDALASLYPDTVARITEAMNNGPSGTMKAYFDNVTVVDTVQCGYGARLWAPVGREVDQVRAGSVRLNGSVRDFRGLTVIGAANGVLIVTTTSPSDPDARETIVFLSVW